VSGMKWQEFIKASIFEPAGMYDSKITDGAYPDKYVAHGYKLVSENFEEYDYGEFPTFCAAGNGGVWSSVDDLARYVKAIKDCSFLDSSTMKISQKVWEFSNWSDPLKKACASSIQALRGDSGHI